MKKFISLLTAFALSLATFVCYAESSIPDVDVTQTETTVDSDIVDETLSNETTDSNEVDELISKINSESLIEIQGRSMKYEFRRAYKFNEDKLEEQRESVKEFLNDVIILSQGQKDYVYTSVANGTKRCAQFVITIPGEKEEKYKFTFVDDNINFWFGGFCTDTPEELMKYIAEDSVDTLSNLISREDSGKVLNYGKYDLENGTITLDNGYETPLIYKEKMEFDIIIDESYIDTVFEEVADIYETVHCTIYCTFSGSGYFILTLEGDKGKKSLWEKVDGIGFTNGYKLSFSLYKYVENNKFICNENGFYDKIYVLGKYEDNTDLKLQVYYEPISKVNIFELEPSNTLQADSLTYECFMDAEQFEKDSLNLYALFNMPDKAEYIEQLREYNELNGTNEQDSERTTTALRGTGSDGVVQDYYITFIAEFPITISSTALPDWCDDLGDDIKATLIGFTQTVDGKDRRNYTMIRFSGSKDTLWFQNGGGTIHGPDGNIRLIENYYHSLISFDGTNKVYNSVSHETVDLGLTFSNDEMELLSIQLDIGSKSQTTDADSIKYIGGGKATHEKIW